MTKNSPLINKDHKMVNFIDKYLQNTKDHLTVYISSKNYEKMAIDIIREDTGIDLTDRLLSDYDEDTYSILTIIDETKITDDEHSILAPKYNYNEHYLTTDYIMARISKIHNDNNHIELYNHNGTSYTLEIPIINNPS